MNDYYTLIKNKLIDNEIYERVKDYSKERNRVSTYFEIGRLLTEAGSKYGDNIIKDYSKKLIKEVGKKFSVKTLYKMRQFYNTFSNKKFSPLARNLSWSHYTELLIIKNYEEMKYYTELCITQNLSKRQLREKIKNKEYYRLSETSRNKLINNYEL